MINDSALPSLCTTLNNTEAWNPSEKRRQQKKASQRLIFGHQVWKG